MNKERIETALGGIADIVLRLKARTEAFEALGLDTMASYNRRSQYDLEMWADEIKEALK